MPELQQTAVVIKKGHLWTDSREVSLFFPNQPRGWFGNEHPTMPCAAKFWTCLRRLGPSSDAPPWLRPIAYNP